MKAPTEENLVLCGNCILFNLYEKRLNEPWEDYGYRAGDYIRIAPVIHEDMLLLIAIL